VIILDTTVLSYAVGSDHPLREPCRRILRAHAEGLLQAATTIEVVQEFVHVRARRRSRSDAAYLARQYGLALPLEMTQVEDLETGLAIYERHQELGAFDSILAATAIRLGAEALVSGDQAFGVLANLHWINPALPTQVERLIGP